MDRKTIKDKLSKVESHMKHTKISIKEAISVYRDGWKRGNKLGKTITVLGTVIFPFLFLFLVVFGVLMDIIENGWD